MERIGIFGGTYNPPHLGHLNIVENFIKKLELNRVMIIPTYTPPHKTCPDLASTEDRLMMCKLTFESEIFDVSDMEIERRGKSYTYDTLVELKAVYPDAEFYFLVGDDMLLTLHEWNKPEEILKLCTIVSSVRCDGLRLDDLISYVEQNYAKQYVDGRFVFLEIEPLVLSSTDVRTKVRHGESIVGLVTEKTADYIDRRGLYRA